jgi:cytochrome P450
VSLRYLRRIAVGNEPCGRGALYLLYTHPEQLAQLIRNPALIPDALEECLRLGSNGYFTFPRIATRDTEVGGTHIIKGMVVRPSPLAPNYDPDAFPDPTRFDIHREPKRILSFGAGQHHCIGNILGRTTITIAIRRLLARGFRRRILLIRTSLPSMAARSANYGCKAFR